MTFLGRAPRSDHGFLQGRRGAGDGPSTLCWVWGGPWPSWHSPPGGEAPPGPYRRPLSLSAPVVPDNHHPPALASGGALPRARDPLGAWAVIYRRRTTFPPLPPSCPPIGPSGGRARLLTAPRCSLLLPVGGAPILLPSTRPPSRAPGLPTIGVVPSRSVPGRVPPPTLTCLWTYAPIPRASSTI